jgi:hypothetical protein
MTGIGLDSVNRPDLNFLKVLYMAIMNVVGDLIAVFVFKSLAGVAIGSVIFTIFGVWIGIIYLDKEIGLKIGKIFSSGYSFYGRLYQTMRGMRKGAALDYKQDQNI